jgi:hypothetical protein
VKTLEQQRADVFARRKALRMAVRESAQRLKPSAIADEALHRFDPELSRLSGIKSRVLEHPLISIALLSGLGWLVGAAAKPSGQTRTTPAARETVSPKPAKQKEKEHDSGQRNRNRRAAPADRRTTEPLPFEPAGEAEVSLAQPGGEAQQARNQPERHAQPQERELGLVHGA